MQEKSVHLMAGLKTNLGECITLLIGDKRGNELESSVGGTKRWSQKSSVEIGTATPRTQLEKMP